MSEIEGFSVEKQDGAEMCRVSAAKAVLDICFPGAAPDQQGIRARFGSAAREANSPEKALRGAGVPSSVEKHDGNARAASQAHRLFVKIDDHIGKGRPVLVYVQQAGGGAFRHALVIFETDPGKRTVFTKDPASPTLTHEAPLAELMQSWKIYKDIPNAHIDLPVFARTFFFTEPRAGRLAPF